jgi:hypothetical protein
MLPFAGEREDGHVPLSWAPVRPVPHRAHAGAEEGNPSPHPALGDVSASGLRGMMRE